MKIFIGCDHRGFALKIALLQALPSLNWVDCGCFNTDRTDYPIYATSVCKGILEDSRTHRGILICGSGIGMSIAANRHKKIYAALCWNEAITMSARADDNANILVLPASEIDIVIAIKLVELFLATDFKGGAYKERLSIID
jgi:ribose 5-phosphate isomerase B